jgi:membrane-bound serine protease (ClpP class)
MKGWLAILAAAVWLWLAPSLPAARVGLIQIDGTIGPATASYIARGIKQAAADGALCLIIQLDTPGGLLDSTKEIVQTFYASSVPTVVYVGPAPAHATSAGCFITLAADVAAMAPNTSIGAAHPVAMSSTGEEKPDEVMKKKLENYAVSFIETIATKRKRNVEWAKASVRDSVSITAEKALELKVIEIIAGDLSDLLKQLDGREVNGKVLRTAGAEISPIPMLMRERIFQKLWRPEVLFILMLIAIYGIIGELSNPGAILPGVAGGIALILTLYMAAVLPINVAGLALIALAIALFVIDIFAPTHGVLTVGGIIAFFLGALMLFERTEPVFRLSLTMVITSTLLTAAFFVFIIGAGLRAQFFPVRVGKEAMLGKTAPALTAINQQSGKVFIEGEYWTAVSQTPIAAGQPVEILSVQGLTLRVKPKT